MFVESKAPGGQVDVTRLIRSIRAMTIVIIHIRKRQCPGSVTVFKFIFRIVERRF